MFEALHGVKKTRVEAYCSKHRDDTSSFQSLHSHLLHGCTSKFIIHFYLIPTDEVVHIVEFNCLN